MQLRYDSIYRALVTNNTDTAKPGNIRVQCPQISGMAEIRSAEPANPGMPVPAVNTPVWIYFSGGDLTKPIYLPNSAPAIPEFTVLLPWTTPGLVSGYTQNGNTNGTVQYRVLDMLGSNLVQWKGGLNVTYPSSTIANGGTWNSVAINALATPAAGIIRTCNIPCSGTTSTTLSLKMDFTSAGLCNIIGTNTTTIQPPWVSLNNVNYFTT